MDTHISFDEMVDYLSCKEADTHFRELAAKINTHIIHCPECRKAYQAILALNDAIDSKVRIMEMSSFHDRTGTSIRNLQKLARIKIDNFRNMLIEGMSFFRPEALGINMSVGSESSENASFFVNDEGVSLDFAKDGTLTVRFPLTMSNMGDNIILQSENDPSIVITAKCEPFNQQTGCIRVHDLEPGSYLIYFESQTD